MRLVTRHSVAYFLLLAAGIGGFLALRAAVPQGAGAGSAATPSVAAVASSENTLFHFLLALVVVMLVARLVGALFQYLHQPPVIGEVLAGILLGPTVLGRVAPDAAAYVLPAAVAPHLGVFAQIGVLLYMFLVGVSLDVGSLRSRSHVTVLVSHTSIVIPFLLGSILAVTIYQRYAPAGIDFTVFALFLGVSMSVTAFPVLARILTDRGLQGTSLGAIALTCAAIDDVTAWCLLALLVSLARAEPGSAAITAGLSVAFVVGMVAVVRPLLGEYLRRRDDAGLTRPVLATLCVGLLGSALSTEAIGIHAIFGAFVFGLLIPASSKIARELERHLQDLTVVLFLPAFFAYTGLRTQIGLVDTATDWLVCLVIIAVATAGKFGGSTIAARALGMGWREAASLGALLNTRGLMELIVLNIGLDLGVLTPTLYAMMVVMALVTTFATTPILALLSRSGPVGYRR